MSRHEILRPYQQDDWDAVCRIHDKARMMELRNGKVDESAFRPMREAAEADEFFESDTLVACIGTEVLGFVSWRDDYITWLYVDPAYHGQGIGRRLLEDALKHAGPNTWTNTIAENVPAMRLYESVGMELVWIRPGDCEGVPCNSARMALPTSYMRSPETTRIFPPRTH